MQTDWQTFAALSIVAIAAFTVFRRLFFSGKSSCGGGCKGCSNHQNGDTSPLVQLSPPKEND